MFSAKLSCEFIALVLHRVDTSFVMARVNALTTCSCFLAPKVANMGLMRRLSLVRACIAKRPDLNGSIVSMEAPTGRRSRHGVK